MNKMEIQIKKTVKAGNSSAVILPRAWLNQEVRVELLKKTHEIMIHDVLNIVKKHMNIKEIIGIYLVGSYAREEEDENSDIDILVLTRDTDKELIKEGNYNLLLVSSELLKQKLNRDLLPVGQMIREAVPLINSTYLDSINVRVSKENIKWYLDTTESKLNIIKEALDKLRTKKNIGDKIAYTLILRMRTLHIIKSLINHKIYSKKDFIKKIREISGSQTAYESYLSVKNSQKDKSKTSIEEAKNLYEYLKNQLEDVKSLFRRL